MYGIRAPPNVIAEVVALFPEFRHAVDMNFLGHQANRSVWMGGSKK